MEDRFDNGSGSVSHAVKAISGTAVSGAPVVCGKTLPYSRSIGNDCGDGLYRGGICVGDGSLQLSLY